MLGRTKTFKPSIWAKLLLVESWKIVLNRATPGIVDIVSSRAEKVRCLDILSVTSSKALLWHSVEIRSKGRVESFSGLSASSAQELKDALLTFINAHLGDLIEDGKDRLPDVDTAIRQITDAKRQYLAQADVSQAVALVSGAASSALSHPLFHHALLPARVRGYLPASFRMITDPAVRQQYNDEFVAHELTSFAAFFDDLGGVSMAREQREACIRLEDSNLLVASAGSGKSATMVGKVAYVLEKGLYAPENILVLAFNRDAAGGLKERIARQLGVGQETLGCRVTTFHALGRGIIEEVDGRPPQLASWVENAAGEARFIDTIIKELTRSDAQFRRLWLDLLTLYPKADIPLDAFGSQEDYRRYIADNQGKRPGSIGTMAPGIYVKSLQEQRIVNWLWLRTIDFEYEKQVQVPTPDDPERPFRYVHPDFFYPFSQTIHEHFAIDSKGNSPFPHYVEHAQLKRAGYASIEADFIETTSGQADEGVLLDTLETELTKRRVPMAQRSDEEILKAVSPLVVTHYHKIIGVCVKHIRANRLTAAVLLKKAQELHDKARATHFAQLVWKIAEAYRDRLEEAKRIDFDSMIGDAIDMVETGRYQSPFSLILVDEFQDISGPRANLIKALRHQKPFTKIFAVGDDWQSIYRFAGSDISLFTDFKSSFGPSWQGFLQQTYRCNQSLAQTAAAFVQQNPDQLKKTVVSSRPAIPRSIRIVPVRVERNRPSFQDACFTLLERVDAFLEGQASQWRTDDRPRLKVLVLWRYNMLDPFRNRTPRFANIEVSGLSFHRSKGLEADYTILLDVSEGDYGVPSRIEDDELLNLVIPRPETYPFAEERRLFYVALTRASRGAFLLCNDRQPSRYIRELAEIAGENLRFETVHGRALEQCPKCLVGQLVQRTGPDGSTFHGCSSFPSCRHVVQDTGTLSREPRAIAARRMA
ncbi:UvrD-helicase domain-containing protein [Sphingobium sp. CFD-2]|uniref:UvrD-helicase domain-containing protein n=1 Tax=Sphingobium sp. CFD-2 TaxID=2878542 RepID=UPI00214B4B2E|nr:UvrD-helicase domain-containing protein [Sphingobium sp. CFD-2]